ncbi:hypothetical protein Ade02nite_27880 [Paractinoplanes deccanensis]|uniref:Peptidase M50 domain-containing protein n=2 Tax=Paractinoplanes deccanensis TaxID=113561 RepID=A0ABQ3Y2E7_9ACTN|nr:hypothetical protein Ade02nite_27880 [Actinoplanes deccanensis]
MSWAIVAPFFTLLVQLAIGDPDFTAAGFLPPVATVLACALVSVPLHEGGHLLAALLLRLEVTEVRIRYAAPAYVRVRAGAPRWRFVLFHLAGPAVNAGIAAALFHYATRPMPQLARECLAAAALTSAVLGLENLVPRTFDGFRSDGAEVLRRLFRPAQARADIALAPEALRRVADGTIDDAALDAFIDTTADARVATAAVWLRFLRKQGLRAGNGSEPLTVAHVTIGPSAAADHARVHAYVTSSAAEPEVFDALAPAVGVLPGLGQLHRVLVDGMPADPVAVARIEAVAAAYAGRRPEALYRRVLDSLVDLLGGRPAEAHDRLLGIEPTAEADRTDAVSIRLLAASRLGDHAEADRLVHALRAVHARAGTPGGGELPPVLAAILAGSRNGMVTPGEAPPGR